MAIRGNIMLLYNEDKKKITIRTNEDNFIDKGLYGSVYRTSALTCAKVYRNSPSPIEVNPKILKTIRELSLKNFYEIYDLLYTKNDKFKGYLMKYYDKFDIDILTTPTDYTLDNLYILRDSILKLTSSNIWTFDLHTDNVILGESTITVIDADLYTFNSSYTAKGLEVKNIKAVNNLFFNLYIDAMSKNHKEYSSPTTNEAIHNLFSGITEEKTHSMTKKLMKYKYPIDYLKAINNK